MAANEVGCGSRTTLCCDEEVGEWENSITLAFIKHNGIVLHTNNLKLECKTIYYFSKQNKPII